MKETESRRIRIPKIWRILFLVQVTFLAILLIWSENALPYCGSGEFLLFGFIVLLFFVVSVFAFLIGLKTALLERNSSGWLLSAMAFLVGVIAPFVIKAVCWVS